METKQLSAAEIAKMVGGTVVGDPARSVTGICDLKDAQAEHVSFCQPSELQGDLYVKMLDTTQAGIVLVPSGHERDDGKSYVICDKPSVAFQLLAQHYLKHTQRGSGFSGIHPTAVIHDEAQLGEGVEVGPHAVIDRGARIGAGSHIGPGVYIGTDVVMGSRCRLAARVVVEHGCIIGDRVFLQAGACIGGVGFGFETGPNGEHVRVEQLGNVVLEDDVEIGCNSTVDRARFGSTTIGAGTKLDNLVEIGHGVRTGQHCMMVGQTGIAGSTRLGNYVILAGKVAVNGHIEVCDGAVVGACSAVVKSITEPGMYLGTPAEPANDARRRHVYMRGIEKHVKQLREISRRVTQLEKEGD